MTRSKLIAMCGLSAALLLPPLLFPGCKGDHDAPLVGVGGRVVNGDGVGVPGATVYLIPADKVNTTPITAQGVLDGTSEPYDEPLEDAVASQGNTFPSAQTDASGNFFVAGALPAEKYFIYVQPAGSDPEHLPGGDACRVAQSSIALLGSSLTLRVSSSPSPTAAYTGSSKCLECHQDYAGQLYTAHRLGIAVPKALGGLQKSLNFPYYEDALDKFPERSSTAPVASLTLYVGDYVGSRGFDKFRVVESASELAAPAVAEFHLYRDQATGEHRIEIENKVNPGDPNSPLTLSVPLSYGGTVYKQRFLVRIPAALGTRKGHYPLLQYQSYPGKSQGLASNYDRSRGGWRDYHFDWYLSGGVDGTIGTGDDLLVAPSPAKTFENNCAACHFTGVELRFDAGTSEWLADAVDDPQGALDIDGDGKKDEVNVGCERCHGPGSEHVQANVGGNSSSRYTLTIKYLSPSRELMICGTCHDRSTGTANGVGRSNEALFDSNHRIPLPGVSRAFVLANHMDSKGPALNAFWDDETHSSKHHQQYADFIKSKKYRNDRELVVCSDCHDSHAYRSQQGLPEFPHNLRADPADPNSALCMKCHNLDPATHMTEKTGSAHAGTQTRCSDCHMPRTARTGPGRFGLLLGTPTGAATDADLVYWMNDVSSHVFDFVKKTRVGVAGKQPGKAMPAPYTNRCGTCHVASTLQYLQPDPK